ncbi:uncharacterized protein TNCV_1212221 [Trichonephila clavipes]|nr:uncharacterized protein TNCV_1212221 [Trichonephila clavipes]
MEEFTVDCKLPKCDMNALNIIKTKQLGLGKGHAGLENCHFALVTENGESPESHSVMKTKLTEEVVAKILPEYQRLASNEILSRCTSDKFKPKECQQLPYGYIMVKFQQDGATCHTARATIDLFKDTFGDCLISRFEPVNWPPRSCDLTPLDYFLWGYVKSLVYADKPQTLDHSEDNIRRVIADIRPQILEKVIENWTSRLVYIRGSRGSPMPEIIFEM